MRDLKPCPFCGGGAVVEHEQECRDAETYFWFVCATCGCETEGEHGRESAAAAWNRRASAPPQEGARETVARIIDPLKWRRFDRFPPHAEHVPRETSIDWTASLQDSLAKADDIIALFRGEGAAS